MQNTRIAARSKPSMYRPMWLMGTLMLLIGLCPSPARAQVNNSVISGKVIDSAEAAVGDATITVRNLATGATKSATTDEQGRYRVQDLPVGVYEVQASATG